MPGQIMLGAYWDARKESLEQCADRLGIFLSEIASCDPSLSQWYEKGKSRKSATARKTNNSDRENLMSLLDRGRNRRDIGKSVIEELGFGVGLWNGARDGFDAGLSIKCGLYWSTSGTRYSLSNYLVLEFPEELGSLKDYTVMGSVLSAAAKVWQPSWAGVFSRKAMNDRVFDANTPFVDWMVYLPCKIGRVPPPSSLTDLPGMGTTVIVQAEPPSNDEPADLERIRSVQRAMRVELERAAIH